MRTRLVPIDCAHPDCTATVILYDDRAHPALSRQLRQAGWTLDLGAALTDGRSAARCPNHQDPT
jgi:hypothetical protein